MSEFKEFNKISRLSRDMIITEKIDGTNAQIHIIIPKVDFNQELKKFIIAATSDGLYMLAGSRNRYITPENDNYGFAKWVQKNCTELFNLGPGTHYGEWWGHGIQRGYGLKEKQFSLFNVTRWNDCNVPGVCDVVPILYKGMFDTQIINNEIEKLKQYGSVAAPGFMKPEGIVILHTASNTLFKKTLEKDESPKSLCITN